MRSLAVLDALLCPEWEFRLYAFDSSWGDGETMGSIRDGAGACVFVVFRNGGAFFRAVHPALENGEAAAGRNRLPDEFTALSREPAFYQDMGAVEAWWSDKGGRWTLASLGARDHTILRPLDELCACLDGDPETYRSFASTYFERDIDRGAIADVYAGHPVTLDFLDRMKLPGISEDQREELIRTGHPVQIR